MAVFQKPLESGGTAEIHVNAQFGHVWVAGYRDGKKLRTQALQLQPAEHRPRPWLTHTAGGVALTATEAAEVRALVNAAEAEVPKFDILAQERTNLVRNANAVEMDHADRRSKAYEDGEPQTHDQQAEQRDVKKAWGEVQEFDRKHPEVVKSLRDQRGDDTLRRWANQ